MTSTKEYHEIFTDRDNRPLENEFLSASTAELMEDRDIITGLLADMKDTGADTSYLEWYVPRAVEEIERRRQRYERHKGGTFPPVWPDRTDFDRWRAEADEVKKQVSIERFLSDQMSWLQFRQQGDRLIARCPYPDHDDETPSFVIFEDGGAWCFGCNRGGDLFRVIGLVEGLPRFRDQLSRALEFVPQTTTSKREHTASEPSAPATSRRSESSIGTFQPIRIVNGKVAS